MLALVISLTLHCEDSAFLSLLNELLTYHLTYHLAYIPTFLIWLVFLTCGLTGVRSLTEGARAQLTP